MTKDENNIIVHKHLSHIFRDLFPKQGMIVRPAQEKLAHTMLDAILNRQIALCDAGTGIGKTYAYLTAAITASLYHKAEKQSFQPILISTSSIALQGAIRQEYLPLLSKMMLEDGVIEESIHSVLRKGKSRYVCDERLERRLNRIHHDHKNSRAVAALRFLRGHLDMDEAIGLSGYDKRQVCVPPVCDCRRGDCQYRRFLARCNTQEYLVQICNHNLLVADAMHRRDGRRPILPDTRILIVDEAHKLTETARQMFGSVLRAEEIRGLIDGLKTEHYLLASERLEQAAEPLLARLAGNEGEPPNIEKCESSLEKNLQTLTTIRQVIGKLVTNEMSREISSAIDTLSQLCKGSCEQIRYAAENEKGGFLLCAAPVRLSQPFQETLWATERGVVLTSGTLAAAGSFRRFREETGLDEDGRVKESITPSPFSYQENCLLYFPAHQIKRNADKEDAYYDELTEEIVELLQASWGHALILFTSYEALTAVRQRLETRKMPYPLFAMGRNARHTVEQFRASHGGVLLAAGAAWEGIDFAGDCVSMLIIPRLPFAYPDAMRDRERDQYASLREYIRAVVVPEMQIKLRQGFGRAIRKETDTCVIAILDDRAGPRHRYFKDVIDALPDMPRTCSVRRAAKFIQLKKAEEYFEKIQ